MEQNSSLIRVYDSTKSKILKAKKKLDTTRLTGFTFGEVVDEALTFYLKEKK